MTDIDPERTPPLPHLTLVPNPAPPVCKLDPDLWFSNRSSDKVKAKALCFTCPRSLQCADAGRAEEHGIWGGFDASLRQRDLSDATREEKHDAVAELLDSRMSITEIAEETGLSYTAVAHIVKRLTDPVFQKRDVTREERRDEVAKLRSEGLSFSEIGRRLSMHHSSVAYIAKKLAA